MNSLALWAAKWRKAVVGGWVLAIVALAGVLVAVGTSFTDSTTLPDSESSTAYTLLAEQSGGQQASQTGQIVWHSSGSVTDPAVRQTTTAMLQEVSNLPGVFHVVNPYLDGESAVNSSTNTAYATVTMARDADTGVVVQAADKIRGPDLQVETGGAAFTVDPAASHGTEVVGLLAALAILLLMFRSMWAAVLPIITGVAGVAVSLLLVMLGSHVLDVASTSLTMGALIGLGVGIDYALFIVNRFRKAAAAGVPSPQAIAHSLNTSGRAVIFAGLTVIVALLGMFVVNLSILTGMAQAAAVTVLFTVAAALTLLPALLAMLGHKVLSKKQRAALAGGNTTPEDRATPLTGPAYRWAGLVQRAPRRVAAAGLLLIVALASPVVAMRVGDADASSSPVDTPAHSYSVLMADGFGAGIDAPLLVVATTPDAGSAAAFKALTDRMTTTPGVASVTAGPVAAGQQISVATVTPTTSAQTEETADLLSTLREDVIPAAVAGTSLQVYVGGTAATSIDLGDALTSKLPLYLALIALLGFLLLAIAFRSIVVPLVAALSNLATIAVGLGVVTAIFQFGWGSGVLGVGSGAPVMYLVPTLLVGVMFGLSMDYQVFLASRVHEEWTHTKDNERSVRVGLAETSKVIAAAALIMLSVFASFGFSGERIISAIGIGLAIAVVFDAFVIRLALIPALMNLLGRRNWWYPRWADRITPRLSVEGPADSATSQTSVKVLVSASAAADAASSRTGV
ncbi:MMPL family transporter [Nakamurella lactea]|uniref:MMPL family transporter n=1 Tax=Nakamurella lactea TaxID=459515 RepID=UPI00041A9144|nr:MMPL family transporter [Nakamurella lactea]